MRVGVPVLLRYEQQSTLYPVKQQAPSPHWSRRTSRVPVGQDPAQNGAVPYQAQPSTFSRVFWYGVMVKVARVPAMF
ncbi:hypothetical protein AB0L00_38485 [Actinoallomurus sp. NPDC052308]|uniref:hypothetical protein n=1 Tax=Actinoallomurus sp. NPDC052308 TaxID=3155530 RepID=UPI003445C04D